MVAVRGKLEISSQERVFIADAQRTCLGEAARIERGREVSIFLRKLNFRRIKTTAKQALTEGRAGHSRQKAEHHCLHFDSFVKVKIWLRLAALRLMCVGALQPRGDEGHVCEFKMHFNSCCRVQPRVALSIDSLRLKIFVPGW